MLLYFFLLIQTIVCLPVPVNGLKAGLVAALVATSAATGAHAGEGLGRSSFGLRGELPANIVTSSSIFGKDITKGVERIAVEKEIASSPLAWSARLHSSQQIFGLTTREDHENWMMGILNGSPEIIKDLTAFIYGAITRPIKGFGDSVQSKVAQNEAERILENNFRWIPAKFQPVTKAALKNRVYEFINLICVAKAHGNPIIRDIGERVQNKLVSLNPNPALAAAFFNSICRIKALR